MGIVEAVKKGFGDSSKVMKVILVFMIFNVVVGLISLPMTNPENANNPGMIAMSAVASIIFFLIFIFLQGGALGLIRDHIKTGGMNFAQLKEYGFKYYKKILLLLLMYFVIAIGVVFIFGISKCRTFAFR